MKPKIKSLEALWATIILGVILTIIPFSDAIGYCNPNLAGGQVCQPSTSGNTTIINNYNVTNVTIINTSNSTFSYNHTQVTYDTWNNIWSTTKNSTYDTWLPNYTDFNKFWYNFTNTISSGDIYNIVTNGVITSNTSAFDDRYLHGSAEYFLTNTTSTDVATYKVMNETIPQSTSMKSLVVSGLTNTQVIESWINSNTNLTFIEAGAITAHLHLTKTTGVQALKIYANITKRNSTGEYGLSTTELSDELTNTLSEQEIHGVIQETFMKPTDKLVMKLVASVTGSGTAPTIKIDTEGETASRLELPIKSTSVSVVETESRFVARNVTIAGIGTTNCTDDKVMVGAEATRDGIFSKCIIAPDSVKFAGYDVSSFAFNGLVLNLDQSTPQTITGGRPTSEVGWITNDTQYTALGTSAIAHWKMNDNSANPTIADSIDAHDGTASVNTDTISIAGQINGALNLSGQYATIQYSPDFNVANAFSISMWVYIEEDDVSGFNVLMAQDGTWALYVQNGGGGLVFYLGSGSNAYSYTNIPLNSWHQVGVTFNGISTYNLIIDGSLILDLQVGLPQPTDNANNLLLGQYTGGIEPAHASFDDVRFYAVELNSSQVAEIYNSGAGTESEISTPSMTIKRVISLQDNGNLHANAPFDINGTARATGFGILNGAIGTSFTSTGGVLINGTWTNGLLTKAPIEQAGITDCYDSASGGQVCSTNGVVTSVTDDPSDEKFKDGITPLDLDVSTATFAQLKPSTWSWNNLSGRQGTATGLVAQDVEKVYPSLVEDRQAKRIKYKYENLTTFIRGVNGQLTPITKQKLVASEEIINYKGLNDFGFIATLVKKIQDQDIKINQLQSDNEKLKVDYIALEKRLTELEARIK